MLPRFTTGGHYVKKLASHLVPWLTILVVVSKKSIPLILLHKVCMSGINLWDYHINISTMAEN